jgi:hypothetical protein
MSCHTCSHVHGCKDARVAHICNSFEYTPLIASREAFVNIVGESAAITALRKQKAMATPEHPNTTQIKSLVSAGDIDGLTALGDNLDIALPYLVMAASHLTGDSTKIGAMLRSQSDKRGALIALLIDLAKEASSNNAVVEENTSVEEAPVVVEEKPKKRRTRRTKKVEQETPLENPVVEDTPVTANVDFDRAFNDVLGAISDASSQQEKTLAAFTKTAKQALQDSNVRYNDLVDRVTRLSNAIVALEDQLMLTGMVLEPAARKCFED